jgi:hypothetical protein
MAKSSKANSALSIKGVLLALQYILIVMTPIAILSVCIFAGSTYLVWQCITYLEILVLSDLTITGGWTYMMIKYALSIGIALGTIYLVIRLIYTYGSTRLFKFRNSTNSLFRQSYTYNNPHCFIFDYELHAVYNKQSQRRAKDSTTEIVDLVRTKYPQLLAQAKQELEVEEDELAIFAVLEKIDIAELSKSLAIFSESLKVTIRNLDNGKQFSSLLEPTKGWHWHGYHWSRPMVVIGNKQAPGLCDGSHYEISIEYVGFRGYYFNMLVK